MSSCRPEILNGELFPVISVTIKLAKNNLPTAESLYAPLTGEGILGMCSHSVMIVSAISSMDGSWLLVWLVAFSEADMTLNMAPECC